MIAVIFEVEPDAAHREAYLDIAAVLRSEVEQVKGFLSVERFRSLTTSNKLLPLSFWRGEDAVARWRQMSLHRAAQVQSRDGLLKDYRLRVAHVLRDYGLTDRDQVPD